MALPKLPGNNFDSNLGKEKFHLSHHFDYSNELPMMVGSEKPGVGGAPLHGQDVRTKTSSYPNGEGSKLPPWIAFDKQVLAFEGYCQEEVNEKREEQFRIRPCKIYFYLEDDSVQVVESRTKNSQMPQGTMIKRHRIPRPPPYDDQFYTVDHFNVGLSVNFYGKVYKLTGCDEFTTNFLTKIGKRVNPSQAVPSDPYTTYRKAMEESMQPLRPYERQDTLKQFLDHDRHVLRFYGFWDDRDNMFGDVHNMVIHYFLADDTIEIREEIPQNAGTDAPSCFLRRGKLPKDGGGMPLPGQTTNRTVLNVFGPPRGHGGRYILDSLKTGHSEVDCYKDCDLQIGTELNVHGRRIKICDCDDFTKHYYRTKFGIEKFEPLPYKTVPTSEGPKEYPPYNGFGGELDSLSSCQLTLQPKPPQKDFVKFMLKDRHGYESNMLRFFARLITDKTVDQDRRFIISYFLSDDTLLVYEPVQRNSGHGGGKFLERQQVKKPGQPRFGTQLSEYYKADDFFIGAVVSINDFAFEIIDMDEYALEFMEKHHSEFNHSNIEQVRSKLRECCASSEEDELLQFFRKEANGRDTMNFVELKNALLTLTNGNVTDHQILCVARTYGVLAEKSLDIQLYSYLIQDFLRKQNFDIHVNKIHEAFAQRDAEKCGHMSVEETMAIIKSTHIPAPIDQLTLLVNYVPRDSAGRVNYEELLRYLNWKSHPIPPPPSYQIGVEDPTKTMGVEEIRNRQERVLNVDYRRLYDDIKPGAPVYKPTQ